MNVFMSVWFKLHTLIYNLTNSSINLTNKQYLDEKFHTMWELIRVQKYL